MPENVPQLACFDKEQLRRSNDPLLLVEVIIKSERVGYAESFHQDIVRRNHWLAVPPEPSHSRFMVIPKSHGKPRVGVGGKDWEDIVLETYPPFWQLIEKRRKQRTLSLQQLKARLTK